MAISTYLASLKWGESKESLQKVVDIKDFPDLIGEPNLLETTTLSDGQQTFIPGIKQMEMMTFTINYTKASFTSCKADEGKHLFYRLELSDGSAFEWEGSHVMGIPGKGVDEVIESTINIVPSSPVTPVATE